MYEKPETVEAYIEWAEKKLAVKYDDRVEQWYAVNTTNIVNGAGEHPLFIGIQSILAEIGNGYREKFAVELFMDSQLKLVAKPYHSMLDKSLRRNILENPGFPEAPENGWFTPESWFAQNTDTVRSSLTCKYIDGPRFVTEQLIARAKNLHTSCRSKSQQNDDGYYAYHFYATIPVDLTTINWTSKREDVEIEIQITTQLQEVLRALTHRVYEIRRLTPGPDPDSWKWDVGSERFHAAYLGHTLHMLEASILALRDKE